MTSRVLSIFCVSVLLGVLPSTVHADSWLEPIGEGLKSAFSFIVNVERTSSRTRFAFLDPPFVKGVEVESVEREQFSSTEWSILKTPLFSLIEYSSEVDPESASSVDRSSFKFLNLPLMSLIEVDWKQRRDVLTGVPKPESEWSLLKLPVIGSLLERKGTPRNVDWNVLFLLGFDQKR